jgi:dihydroxyacetone kinase
VGSCRPGRRDPPGYDTPRPGCGGGRRRLRALSSVRRASVQAGATLAEAWRLGADAATEAAAATRTLLPKVGRARPHAERSLGTPDAGAISLALIASRVADLLADRAAATSPVNQATTSTTKASTL